MIHQAGNFIGLGTDVPAGPLEVLDQRISPGSRPNVANIIITQDDGGQGYSAADCLPTDDFDMWGNPITIPAPYHCFPDNALVLRKAQYSNGTPTGHAQLFTLTRGGLIGIRQAPYSGSALTTKAGWIDIERTSSSSGGNVGIRLRGHTGTIHHTIGTDAGNNNQLTITPGVGSAASDVLKVAGGLEVTGASMFHGPIEALHDLQVNGSAAMANGLAVGGSLSVGQSATIANDVTIGSNLNVGSTGHFGWGVQTQYLHVNYDVANPGNTPYPAGLYHAVVWGDMLVKRVKVAVPNTNAWFDHVFKEDYALRPLADVEKFIQEHKHLPDVPSAEEVVKNGVDLQTMDATLLRKVEELTLYMLAQQKEIEGLKKELERRKK